MTRRTIPQVLTSLAVTAAIVLTGAAPGDPGGSQIGAQASAAEASPAPAVSVSQISPAPLNGDGFWFTGGVQATRLNRVVRMAPDTPPSVRALVAEVVRQINAASGAGVAIGPDTTASPAADEIVVRVPVTTICGAGAAGCAANAVATTDGIGVVVNALVELRRDLVGSGYELPVLLHEMGHAMGLGHYDEPYRAAMQLMWNSVTTDMTAYRDGDRNGLAALGAVFTNRNVVGTIDRLSPVPGGVRVQGWVLDLDAPSLALEVNASLDGASTSGTANTYRPDVGLAYPGVGDNHGIDLVIPTAGIDGAVTMCLTATGGRGLPVGVACRATTANHSPLGLLEVARQQGPTAVLAAGWALDPDTLEPLTVEVRIDGVLVGTTTTDRTRTDIAAAYPGFPGPRGWRVEVADVTPGSRRVCARGIDATGDPNRSLGCQQVLVGGGNPIGNVEGFTPGARTPLALSGWAIDPDTTAPVDIHLFIDGRYVRTGTADRPRPDVAAAYPGYGPDHGFSVAIPGLAVGTHVACAFAINQFSGTANTLLGCRSFRVSDGLPFGSVEGAIPVDGRLSLVGWAIDPNTIDPIDVHVWAGSRIIAAGLAGRSRPDVGAAFPAYGDRHGFALPLDRLGPGTHWVCAYGINAGGAGANPALGCQWVRVG